MVHIKLLHVMFHPNKKMWMKNLTLIMKWQLEARQWALISNVYSLKKINITYFIFLSPVHYITEFKHFPIFVVKILLLLPGII